MHATLEATLTRSYPLLGAAVSHGPAEPSASARARERAALLRRVYLFLADVRPLLPPDLEVQADRLQLELCVHVEVERERAAPECTFAPGEQAGTWWVGNPAAARVVAGGRAQAALTAAWRAMTVGSVPWVEVTSSERMARKVSATACRWARRHCRELEIAFARLGVSHGRLQYSPGSAVRVLFESECQSAG